jgi:hypothetical protein
MDLLESSSDEDSELVTSFARCSVYLPSCSSNIGKHCSSSDHSHSIARISLQSCSKQNPQDQNIPHVGKKCFDETATLNEGKENNAKLDQNVSNCRRVDVGIRGLGCSTSNKSIIAAQQTFLDSSLFESQSWHPVDRTLLQDTPQSSGITRPSSTGLLDRHPSQEGTDLCTSVAQKISSKQLDIELSQAFPTQEAVEAASHSIIPHILYERPQQLDVMRFFFHHMKRYMPEKNDKVHNLIVHTLYNCA